MTLSLNVRIRKFFFDDGYYYYYHYRYIQRPTHESIPQRKGYGRERDFFFRVRSFEIGHNSCGGGIGSNVRSHWEQTGHHGHDFRGDVNIKEYKGFEEGR